MKSLAWLTFLIPWFTFSSSRGDDQTTTPALQRIREVISSGEQEVRVVCFGDSVTGLYYHSGGRRAYPELIGESLAARHPVSKVTVINAGKSGHTTTNGLGRIQQDVLVHHPHLVTVMFGLNDVAKGNIDLYRKNLVEILSKCRAAGAEVILCTPNAVSETEARPVAKVAAFAEIARSVAREWKVPLADVHTSLETLRTEDPEAWRLSMSDEIHPNLRGHRRLAESILENIEGTEVSLSDSEPVPDPLAFTVERLKRNLPVKVLAMPPFDTFASASLSALHAGAQVSTTNWPVEGLDRRLLMKDAAKRVRPLAPNLVIVSIPRSAGASDTEEFIRTQMWIASNSLAYGKREWDVLVVHPDVFEGRGSETDRTNDARIRTIVPAQDLPLLDRLPEDNRPAEEILRDWIARHAGM
ncbi:MAG: hypothetical protein KDN18_00800 [Verrucomicrobiae bacterium]|nr:hypothetical protein [Verrucomicrobiae bacterium]